jgi:protoheme IX farnesyltransferase
MAPGVLSLADFGVAMLGTSLTIASANAGNQAMEVEYDKLMQRTRLRMLPRELLTVPSAVAFSAACGVAGTGLLYAAVNPVAAALAAGNIVLYVFVYTPMKRIHWINTWIGAVVGAIPPLIGWAAATGGTLGPGALALGAVLYAWQIPHFISLSWTIRRDYEAGGYRMMALNLSHKIPSVILLWSLYALPLGLACYYADLTTQWFALTSLVPGIPLVLAARKFSKERSNNNSRLVFRYTLAWLPAFLGLMLFHKKEYSPWEWQPRASRKAD